MFLKNFFTCTCLLVIATLECIAQKKNNAIKLMGTLVDCYSYYKFDNFKKIVRSRTTILEYYRNLGENEYSTWAISSGIGYSKINYNSYDWAIQAEKYNDLTFFKLKGGLRYKESLSKVTLFYIDLGIVYNYGFSNKTSLEAGVTQTILNFGNSIGICSGGGIHLLLTNKIRFDIGLYGENDLTKISINQKKIKFIKNNIVTSLYYAF